MNCKHRMIKETGLLVWGDEDVAEIITEVQCTKCKLTGKRVYVPAIVEWGTDFFSDEKSHIDMK